MSDSEHFDLIVIGTGSGGSVAAGKCAGAGWKVAQIDSRPFGGTCARRGCDPKKVLVGAAEAVDWTRRMKGRGVHGKAEIDWQNMMEFKRGFTEPVPENREKAMEKQGITPVHGRARFTDERTLRVGGRTLTGDRMLIAAGAKPAPLPIDGIDHMVTSTDFLELDNLPDSLIFVGGGYISFEFAHIAARAGSEVHIVHRGDRPLENFDADLSNILLEKTRQLGITVQLNAEVQTVRKSQNHFTVEASQNGDTKSLKADLVVHGAGRVPDIDDMQLDHAKVERDKGGIVVNDFLQSPDNPRVYAAGDAASSPGKPLTPVAGFESHIVASNLLNGNNREAKYPVQPSMVFTIPPLAMAGLTEDEANERGLEVDIKSGRTDGWYSSKRTNETHTGYKTLVDKESDTVIGAHLIGEQAPELINMLTMAINRGIKTTEMKQMIFAYPTYGSNLQYMI
ncbi:MAG: NAD(P)/FAD-dependent oxidoreductase [Balneolaceae bacterium]|nr:NAD(P)/FAD-dependent oxidoreductase [Balneolaceae bacterium]